MQQGLIISLGVLALALGDFSAGEYGLELFLGSLLFWLLCIEALAASLANVVVGLVTRHFKFVTHYQPPGEG